MGKHRNDDKHNEAKWDASRLTPKQRGSRRERRTRQEEGTDTFAAVRDHEPGDSSVSREPEAGRV